MVKEINLCWYFLFYASYAIKRPYTFLYERGERTSADLVYTCSIVKYRNTSTIDVVWCGVVMWWCADEECEAEESEGKNRFLCVVSIRLPQHFDIVLLVFGCTYIYIYFYCCCLCRVVHCCYLCVKIISSAWSFHWILSALHTHSHIRT